MGTGLPERDGGKYDSLGKHGVSCGSDTRMNARARAEKI
jgi:hypothetical protein